MTPKQVRELEEALAHSKAKESTLKQNLAHLTEQLVSKNNKLNEKRKVIETLESVRSNVIDEIGGGHEDDYRVCDCVVGIAR